MLWATFGKAGGVIRNRRMLEVMKPALVVAFPGDVGTGNMVHEATRAGVSVMDLRAAR